MKAIWYPENKREKRKTKLPDRNEKSEEEPNSASDPK